MAHHEYPYEQNFEFVNDVPEYLTCPVCLGPLKDPHLVSCCGKKFCEVCIVPNKSSSDSSHPCPFCRCQRFTSMLDKELQRSVLNLTVYCSYKPSGCSWEGELMYLQKHIVHKCLYTTVPCKYCGKEYARQDIGSHEEHLCDCRPMEVRFMSKMNLMESKVQWLEKKCEEQGKEVSMLQDELKREIAMNAESMKVLQEERLRHKEELSELKETVERLKEVSRVQLQEYKKTVTVLDEFLPGAKECQKFTQNLSNSCRDWALPVWQTPPPIVFSSSVPPCQFIMKGFTNYRDMGEVWHGPPFYSWAGGYKMCLQVYANGTKEAVGKYMSVDVIQLEGEYDDMQVWPQQCLLKVLVLNQLANANHIGHSIAINLFRKPDLKRYASMSPTSTRMSTEPNARGSKSSDTKYHTLPSKYFVTPPIKPSDVPMSETSSLLPSNL